MVFTKIKLRQWDMLLSKLKEISAGIDWKFPNGKTMLHSYLVKIGLQYRKSDNQKVIMKRPSLVSYDTVRMLCTKGTMLWWYKRLFFIRTTADRKTSSNKSCWKVWKRFRKFPFTLWKITFNAIRGLPWWYEWNCIWGLAWEHFNCKFTQRKESSGSYGKCRISL